MSYPRYPRTYFDVVDGATPINSELFGKFTDAIINIQDQLGDNPSGVFSNIRQRLDALEVGDGGVLYHNDLLGIQGGDVDGYYHLTDYEHSFVTIAYNDGYWSASYGGTGQTSYIRGDILYADDINSLIRLPIGPEGYYLKVVGGIPSWDEVIIISEHNDTIGIQGGSGIDGYYHLTATEHDTLTTSITEVDGYLTFSDGYTSPTTLFEIASSSAYIYDFVDDDLSTGILFVEHGLNNKYVIVDVYDDSDKKIIPDEVTLVDENNCTIDLTTYGTITGTWHAVVSVGATITSSTPASSDDYTIPIYEPDLFTWTDTGVIRDSVSPCVIRIGEYWYQYGGNGGSNKIIKWPTTSPTHIGIDTGITVPVGGLWNFGIFIDKIVLISADTSGPASIYTAPINDPTNLTLVGTMPSDRRYTPFAIGDGCAVIYNGYNGGGLNTATLCSDLSHPETWVDQSGYTGVYCWERGVAVVRDTIYKFQGYNSGAAYISKYPAHKGYLYTNDVELGISLEAGWPIGIPSRENLYIFGSSATTNINQLSLNTNYHSIHTYSGILPTYFTYAGLWIDSNGYAYVATTSNNHIYKSGRMVAYAKTTPTDCRAIQVRLPDGSMSTIHSDRLLGFRRHLTSDLTVAPLV